MSPHISEIDYYFKLVTQDLDQLASAVSHHEVRKAWEQFLSNYGKAIGKLISASKTTAESRALGHQLKNNSNGNDQGLHYLREARNAAEHGLESVSKYKEASVWLGSDVRISGDSTVTFKNSYLGGLNISDASITTKQGVAHTLEGDAKKFAIQSAAETILVPVKNPEKRITVDPPSTLGGAELTDQSALTLAKAATSLLDSKISEYRDLTSSSSD